MPGQQYARELVTDGINVVTDATGRVIDTTVDFVPGAAAAGHLVSEALDVIPGRELLPRRSWWAAAWALGSALPHKRTDEILNRVGTFHFGAEYRQFQLQLQRRCRCDVR